jgi:hypothetical protein
MTTLFLHGWTSVPGGVKPTYLATHGHTVINPKLPDEGFAEAVSIDESLGEVEMCALDLFCEYMTTIDSER